MKKWFIGAIAVFATILLGYAFFNSTEAEESTQNVSSKPKPALSVRIDQVQEKSLPIQIKAYGNIAPWHEMIVGSETMDLRLVEVAVDVGDFVKKGQVLAIFDIESVKADIEQMHASLIEAKAVYAEAKENEERMRSLKNSGALALSEKSIAEYVRAEKAAGARVAVAQAALDAQKIRLKNATVIAPDEGIISSRSATIGAVMGIGGELFRIVRKNRLEWRAELMSHELTQIKVGTLAELSLTNGEYVQGTVRVVAPTVSNLSRVGLVYVDLVESPMIRAGMFVQGVFKLGESVGFVVPSQSVVTRDSFNYVFVLGEENHVHQVKVTTGRRVEHWVEILNGINVSHKIVTAGAGFLNDGDVVHVVKDEAVSISATNIQNDQSTTDSM